MLLAHWQVLFWTLHLDPLLSIVLASVPAYLFGKYFTENIFAQKPLVTQAPCPNCNYLLTTYFGDLFNVMADGIAGPKTAIKSQVKHCALLQNTRGDGHYQHCSPKEQVWPHDCSQVECVCPNCKAELIADRDEMIIKTIIPKL